MVNRSTKTSLLVIIAFCFSVGVNAADRQIGQYSPWPDRTQELGQIMQMVYKTLNHTSTKYSHEINDALVKATLTHIQFAKDHDLLKEMVEHEVKIQRPMLERVAKTIQKTGDKELALKAAFDQTACHWQLILDTKMEPGMRQFVTPFENVLKISVPLGQHDLTLEEIHNIWLKPRYERYGEVLGVPFEVDPYDESGIITVRIKDYGKVSMR